MGDGPVVGHMDSHLGILGESGVILDESEGLVLELHDENSLELARRHTHSLVSKVGVGLLDRKRGLDQNETGYDSKHSLHGKSGNDGIERF